MAPKMFWIFTCAVLLLMLITVVLVNNNKVVRVVQFGNDLSQQPLHAASDTYSTEQSGLGLQVLVPAEFANLSDFNCISAKIGNQNFPMCVYNFTIDTLFSKMVSGGSYAESEVILKLISFFRTNPNLSFVDLGANLGSYSLPIAHLGIHVVSVEPYPETVRILAKSVHLGKLGHNVDIFPYALSNAESTTLLEVAPGNPGNTYMVGNGSCPRCMSANVTVLNKLIPFIRHKKVFIKVDVQEAEIKVFQRQSAAKFFDEIDVLMIQMEWVLYPQNYGKTEAGKREVDRFLDFFYQRGYDVYDPREEIKLKANWIQWPVDVLFKKKDLPKDKLFMI